MKQPLYRWLKRLLIGVAFVLCFIFVVVPVAASYFLTGGKFRYTERGPHTAAEVGLDVSSVSFLSSDAVDLHGWWSPGDRSKPVIIFCHGLNRSRLELLERAAEASRRGFGILLFDLRNHGQSGPAYTTLGIHESKDVCAASQFVREQAGRRSQVLWGVSMGASSALLGAKRCSAFRAVVADSAFLSFRETIARHVNLFLHLPSFPIANMVVSITGLRLQINPDDGDVEAAVESLRNVPVLFIAGTADRRMPPEHAERLKDASKNPRSELLIVPGATHGEAYSFNKSLYLDTVFAFLSRAL